MLMNRYLGIPVIMKLNPGFNFGVHEFICLINSRINLCVLRRNYILV